ncbi:MAG: WD40 repeat domain-containing protein, partial [Bacteroidaceae bacterium]|nr:WD40 repeat domain-containing protein [Bacteroidaceae bacterium]
MKQNPWLGLASYDEQAVAQGYKFCGRERAINELYSIVDNNLLTTLYGKSGIGKSSLLQAGVFPRLRTDNYLPVMIRLGAGIAGNYSYTTIVMDAVRKAVAEAGDRCVATQDGEAACEEERLWHFFHSTEFQSAGGDTLFPVIVLDQFEELYYRDKQQLSTLLKALYLLVDDSPLSSSDEDEVPNYRIVLSIREDDLFHLEDSIDKLRLTEMKYNRYRLRELTDDEARDIILLPGASLFFPSEADAIANRIIQEAKAGSEEISTAVLSLLCSRIYYACPTLTDSSASMGITLQRITEFFRQAEGNFLKSFYDDIIKELKSPAKWYYIEDTLVTDEGRRNSVLKSEFDKRVPNSDFLFRGEKSMLRCITTAGTDEPRVEIIHDMLARQMMSSRNERKLQEQAKALRKQRITAIAIILLAIVLGAVFYTQYRSIVAERNSMLKMQSHYIAEKAERLIEEGKYTLATRLLSAVFPEDLNKPNRPHVANVEVMLRNADYSPQLHHLVRAMKHDNNVSSAAFSPDGKYVVTASWDNTAKIWDAQTGKQVGETIKHDKDVRSAAFSPDGNYIVTASEKTAKIWDAQTGKQVGEPIKHDNYVNSAAFSPDGKYVVTASWDNTAKIWDAQTIKQVGETMKHDGIVRSAAFSPDGNYIVTASEKTAKIWDAQTGKQVGETIKHDKDVRFAAFSPDGNYIVTASWDKTAKIWDAQTIKQVGETMKHDGIVESAAFSPDGNYIVTASYDNTAKIWDVQTGKQVGEIMKHDNDVSSAAFSPDGKYVVTASDDNTAKIWDAQTGKQVGENMKHDWNVESAAFSPDGNSSD